MFPELPYYLMATPAAIVNNYQVWRLLTGALAHTEFLHFFFSVFSYFPTACNQEKLALGTVRQAFNFLTTVLLVEVIFCSICKLLNVLFSTYAFDD